MILHRGLAVPLLLTALVLGTTVPILQAMLGTSEGVFYGPGVYIVTQRRLDKPLDLALVEDLRRQPGVQGVSPEVYAPTVALGEGLMVRGIDPEGFASVEGLQALQGEAPHPPFALAGRSLAARLHLAVGQPLILTGSLYPAVAQVRITGIVATGGPSDDELLVPLRFGSWLGAQGSRGMALIRVRTTDPRALGEFLLHRESAGGGPVLGSAPQGDDRIARLILLDPHLGGIYGRTYMATFARYGINSLRVALDGLTLLTLALFALGGAAALGKGLEEERRTLGLLKALGASRGQVTLWVLGATLRTGGPATVAGAGAGLGVARALVDLHPIVLLGHTVKPALDPLGILWVTGAAIASIALAAVTLTQVAWARPCPRLLGRGGEEAP